MKLKVLMALTTKSTVFLDVTPHNRRSLLTFRWNIMLLSPESKTKSSTATITKHSFLLDELTFRS